MNNLDIKTVEILLNNNDNGIVKLVNVVISEKWKQVFDKTPTCQTIYII